MNILCIILALLAVASVIWIFWNVLQIIYHTIMSFIFGVGFIVTTVYECLYFIVSWTVIAPVRWLLAR